MRTPAPPPPQKDLTQGVIYYNKGRKCVLRMIVSMMSMREHYKGPISLFLEKGNLEQDAMDRLAMDVAKTFGVNIIRNDNPDTTTYVRAVEVCIASPYDITVWMDADTVILGEFSQLFEEAKTHDLVIAHFAGWNTDGRTISKRIMKYNGIVPQYMKEAIAYGPAINCGVYSFPRWSRMLKEWLEVAKQGEKTGMFIPDEVACQVLLPQYDVKIMPIEYNQSVVHGPDVPNPRVIHYHGRKHCKDFPRCIPWLEKFEQAMASNVCHIRDYTGKEYGDRRLDGFLRGKYGLADHVKKIKEMIASAPSKAPSKSSRASESASWPADEGKAKSKLPPRFEIVPPGFVPPPPQPKAVTEDTKNLPVDPALVTVVTACDPKYVETLRMTFQTWKNLKNITQYKLLVFVNGIDIQDRSLRFLRRAGATLVPWSMPNAADHREEMLSAFVLGTAKHVTTPYWLKLDADSYATDQSPLILNWMTEYCFCGHRWGYSWAKHIKALDEWSAKQRNSRRLRRAKPMYDEKCVAGRRYYHPGKRTISFIQLQSTEFTKLCASLAGDRLPVPSHDTYLYYIANQLGMKWSSSNFKGRRGFVQGHGKERVEAQLKERGLLS